MSEHAVIQAADTAGTAITPTAVQLQGAATHNFADVAGQGLSLDLSGVAAGDYSLVVALPNRPELPFKVKVEDKSSVKLISFRGKTPACCALTKQAAASGSASSRTLYVFAFTMEASHSEVVLVAGWDYSGGADNTKYATTWRDDLQLGYSYQSGKKKSITKVITDSTLVTMFDFESGNRTRWLKGRKGWHQLDVVLQGTVATHTGKYSTPANVQKRHDDDSMSIVHVYEYVADIGKNTAGALLRFDIFSHAWAGGPILVNTNQDAEFSSGGARETERDPGDKDGRLKDFSAVNMPRAADFKAAFGATAVGKVWGCFATTDYRKLVRAAAKASDKTKKLKIQLSSGEIEATANQIKDYFKNTLLPGSYMGLLSGASGVGVWGAPLGLGANLHSVGKRNYMHIEPSSFPTEYKWFKDEFSMTPDDSGYLEFK